MASLFITGASGFIGRAVLVRCERDVTCLSRRPTPDAQPIRWVQGELADAARYRDALGQCDAVLHIAGQTGQATEAVFTRTNVDGTRALLDACRGAGVRRLVHVSSIAVCFEDVTDSAYARSKQAAEALVRDSGLDWTIVRPTIVLGAGSPAARGLAAMARLPLTPLLGEGSVRVQPVHVDDVARALLALLDDPQTVGQVVEVGGPEVVTIRELMTRLCRLSGRPARFLRLPTRPVLWGTRLVERVLGPNTPVSAGQLTGMRFDSTARSSELVPRAEPLTSLDEMLREAATTA